MYKRQVEQAVADEAEQPLAHVGADQAGGVIGAEVQHYQDPEQIDLRAVLDTLVVQLEAWLVSPSDEPRAAVTGGGTHG